MPELVQGHSIETSSSPVTASLRRPELLLVKVRVPAAPGPRVKGVGQDRADAVEGVAVPVVAPVEGHLADGEDSVSSNTRKNSL